MRVLGWFRRGVVESSSIVALRNVICVALALLLVSLPNLASPARGDDEADDPAMADEMPADDAPPKSKSKTPAKKPTKATPKSKSSAKSKTKTPAKVLRYGFEEGKKYVYAIEMQVDLGDGAQLISGNGTYTVASASDDKIVLDFAGHLVGQTRTSRGPSRFHDPRHRSAFQNFPSTFGGPAQVTMDSSGKIASDTGKGQLPYLLGSVSTFVLEPLSPEGESKWEVSNSLTVGSRPKPVAPQHGPGRSRSRATMKAAPAAPQFASTGSERSEYQRGATKGNLVTIKKHFELQSAGGGNSGVPAFNRLSDGEILFDTKAGVPSKGTFRDALTVVISETKVTIPMTVTYRLLDDKEMVALEKGAAEAKARAEAKAEERNRPLDDAEVRRLLVDLRSADKRRAALDRLAKGPANDQQDKVAKQLNKLLKDPDRNIQKMAVKALEVWGGADDVPALIGLIDEDDVFLRSDVIKTLTKLKDERAAEAVAKQLPFDRGNASRSLTEMGELAEPAVIPYLEDRDEAVRIEACKILGTIGTTKSVSPLEKLAGGSKRREGDTARQALKQIASRN